MNNNLEANSVLSCSIPQKRLKNGNLALYSLQIIFGTFDQKLICDSTTLPHNL